jgi:hypothetical protein
MSGGKHASPFYSKTTIPLALLDMANEFIGHIVECHVHWDPRSTLSNRRYRKL